MHAALGIMVALFARERSGFGQFIDISYLDTTLALLGASPAMKQVWSDEHVPLRGR
jgi:crotonobetainyl-CoA:carnitine CoA-transferase CaiB-like acyl-CoA transferase